MVTQKTLNEELAFWRSVELGHRLAAEKGQRRLDHIDAEIARLQEARRQAQSDWEQAPVMIEKAQENIRRLNRLVLATRGGVGPRTTVKSAENKKAALLRKVERLRHMREQTQKLEQEVRDARAAHGNDQVSDEVSSNV